MDAAARLERGRSGRALVRAAILAAALLAPRPATAEPASPTPATLRLLSFNVWGIPGLSPDLSARLPKIADAIVALGPDVVLLQEVWHDQTAQALSEALRDGGFAHQLGRSAGGTIAWGSTGILVASRTPLVDPRWIDYESGQLPHTPYHADWAGTKAALVFDLETSAGPLRIATTHMQASYATGSYEPVRLAQTLQLVEALRGGDPGGEASLPTIVAGDLNYEPSEVGERVLRGMLGLESAFEGLRWDAVLHRRGAAVDLRIRRAEQVLTEPVELEPGTSVPLSDHPGLWVELELVPRPSALAAATPAPAAALAGEALDAELSLTRWQQRGAGLAFVAVALVALRVARKRPWRRPVWAAVWLSLCFVGATYAAYFAWGYAPAHLRAMERARARVVAMVGSPEPR